MNVCQRILGLSDNSLSKLKKNWSWLLISLLHLFWHLAKRQVVNMKTAYQADSHVIEELSFSSGRILLLCGHFVEPVYTSILRRPSTLKFKFSYKKKKKKEEIKHCHITAGIKDCHILKRDNQWQLRKSRIASLSVWKFYLQGFVHTSTHTNNVIYF